jgi:hypothetical protein
MGPPRRRCERWPQCGATAPPEEDSAMATGTVKWFKRERVRFHRSDDGSADLFSHCPLGAAATEASETARGG